MYERMQGTLLAPRVLGGFGFKSSQRYVQVIFIGRTMDIADIKWLGWLYLRLGTAFAILYYAAVILFYAGIVEHEKNEAWSSLMWRAFKHTSLLMLLVAPVAAGEVALSCPGGCLL